MDVRRQEHRSPDGGRFVVMVLNGNEEAVAHNPVGFASLINAINWILAETVVKAGWQVVVVAGPLDAISSANSRPLAVWKLKRKRDAAQWADQVAAVLRARGSDAAISLTAGH